MGVGRGGARWGGLAFGGRAAIVPRRTLRGGERGGHGVHAHGAARKHFGHHTYIRDVGPHHETTAEHRMAHRLGADVVGTGVVPEVLTARHMGVHVMALTLLTAQHLAEDDGAPSSEGPSLQTGRSQLHRLLVATVAANEQSGSQ